MSPIKEDPHPWQRHPAPPAVYSACDIVTHLPGTFSYANWDSNAARHYWLAYGAEEERLYSTKALCRTAFDGRQASYEHFDVYKDTKPAWRKYCHIEHPKCPRHPTACSRHRRHAACTSPSLSIATDHAVDAVRAVAAAARHEGMLEGQRSASIASSRGPPSSTPATGTSARGS
ncbi:hypothetical protein DFH06DRAFT_1168339, partial [Mycena polygramma]